jgi:hypothetical protein
MSSFLGVSLNEYQVGKCEKYSWQTHHFSVKDRLIYATADDDDAQRPHLIYPNDKHFKI